MITSSLVDAEVRARTITQPDPFSVLFKLCFRLWEWSKCYATHIVFAIIAAVTVACAPGTSFLSHCSKLRQDKEMSNVYIGAPLPHVSQSKVVTE
ncbi:hypothetical protein PoB_001398600 [Plakobranchus ocellatus]|uniref:Uncharacterized protein n=1 Tax=Plakobranchus ocellatus TaxID=259542 RepID=A0AAV3YVJ7_9GAST|nr:hypothetical protein PoB_001398600 [Plakobranchus ocellatus]